MYEVSMATLIFNDIIIYIFIIILAPTPTDSEGNVPGGISPIFYAVISGVGFIIILVVVVAFVYHCVILKKWVNRNRDDTEE